MSLTGCSTSDSPSSSGPANSDPGAGTDCTTGTCPFACQLVSLTVVSGASQTNVSGPHHWAAVKRAGQNIIVQANTNPDTPACWSRITWSGDSGSPVAGHANQRQFSRANVARFDVRAELGGVAEDLTLWVIWAQVQILTTGRRPHNAQAHPPAPMGDGSDNLGAIEYTNFAQQRQVAGKIVAVATIQPAGIHNFVTGGWVLKRERWTHDWVDGARNSPGNGHSNQWNTAWVDDTLTGMSVLTPDLDDKVYDTDAPNLGMAAHDYETYNNFRQWLEWNNERASDSAPWFFQARWQNNRVTTKDVGTGNIQLPNTSFFHP